MSDSPYILSEPYYNQKNDIIEFPKIRLRFDIARDLLTRRLKRDEYNSLLYDAVNKVKEFGFNAKENNNIPVYDFIRRRPQWEAKTSLIRNIQLPGGNQRGILMIVQRDLDRLYKGNCNGYLRYSPYVTDSLENANAILELWKLWADFFDIDKK